MASDLRIISAEFLNEHEVVIALSNGEDILISLDRLLTLDLPRLVWNPSEDEKEPKASGAGRKTPRTKV